MEKPKSSGSHSARPKTPAPAPAKAAAKPQPTPPPAPAPKSPPAPAVPPAKPTPAPAAAPAPAKLAPAPAPKAATPAKPSPAPVTPPAAPKAPAKPATPPTPPPSAPKASATPAPAPVAPKPAGKAATPLPPAIKPEATPPKPAAPKTAAAAPAPAAKAESKPAPSPAPSPAPKASATPKAAPAPAPVPVPTPPPAPAPAPAATAPAVAPAKPAPKSPKAAKPAAPVTPAPSILLEDDANRPPLAGGPGDRYVLGAVARPGARATGAPGELPSAYGTGRLLLVARDPHWLYAHWDLTDTQLRDYNRKSIDGHLILRVYAGALSGAPLLEQGVHPESRNWFLHVPSAGTAYVAELGYRGTDRAWTRVSVSSSTLTPTEELSAETWIRFETLPFDVPMATLVQLVRQVIAGQPPLIEAIAELRALGHVQLPPPATLATPGAWTPEQEQALAQVLSMDEVRRVWIGSLEITELLRRQLIRGLSSGEVPLSSAGAVPGLGSLSSPIGGAPAGARGFWFNVNAELIVYGATDPQATVRIGDRTIQLRPDGTFSYRFSLPDGQYGLPIRATSPDKVETRTADLAFERRSQYQGEVGAHPQDAALRSPSPEHVA